MLRSIKMSLAVILLVSSTAGHAKQNKFILVKAEQQKPVETSLAEIQSKFIEEQPGYIVELGMFDAEMEVALALYQTSHGEAAKTHFSHSNEILYRRLLNRVLARRAPGFSNELAAFTKGMEAGESYKSLKLKHEKLRLAIVASRGKGEFIAVAPMLTAANLLMKKSVEYFNSGVANGEIVDLGQYQDAWGYMKVAKALLTDISKNDRNKNAAAFKEINTALADLHKLWPSLTSGETSIDGPQILSEAAIKIEERLPQIVQP